MGKTIVNEILAFLQQKLREGQMDAVTAAEICSSRFTVDEICAAKKVLFQSIRIVGIFVPHRRGDEAGRKTIEDIIEVLTGTDHELPEFVTTEVCRSPSNVPDNVDAACLLKEIVALKAGMAEILRKFEESQAVIAVLRNEIIRLHDNTPVTRSLTASNFKDTGRVSNADSVTLPAADTAHSSARAGSRPPCPLRAGPPISDKKKTKPHRLFSDVVSTGEPVAARRKAAPTFVGATKTNSIDDKVREVRDIPKEETPRTVEDKEGFTTVSRKRKPRKSQCGTAEPVGCGLRVSTPSKALYVSRCHHNVTVEEVAHYVRQKTGFSLRVVQLHSRQYVHFNSFVLNVPQPLLETIASAEFWPRGVVFRRFRGSLPNPTSEVSTQRGHAVSSPK